MFRGGWNSGDELHFHRDRHREKLRDDQEGRPGQFQENSNATECRVFIWFRN